MTKSTGTSTRHFVGLFLALTLTVPTPVFALRTPEKVEAKGGLEELEWALRNPSDPGRAAATVLGRQLATTLGISTAQPAPVPAAGLEESIPVSELLGFVIDHAIHSTTKILYLTYLGQKHPIQPPGTYRGVQTAVEAALSALNPTGIVEATVDYANREIRLSVPALLGEFEGGPLRESVPEPSSGEVEERNPTEAYGIIQGLRTKSRVEVRFPDSLKRGSVDSILLEPLKGLLDLRRVDLEQKSIQLRATLARFTNPASGQVKFRVETERDPIVVTLLRPDTGTRVTDPPGGGPFRRPGPSSGPGEIQERLPIPPGVDDRSSRSRIGGPASDVREPDDIEVPVGQQVPAAGLEQQIPGTNIQVSWSTTSNDPAEDLRFLTEALSRLKQLDPESYRNATTSIRTITLMNLPADQWATHAPSQGTVNLQWPFLLSETEADREILLLGVLVRGAEYRRFAEEALENLDLIDVDAGGDAIDGLWMDPGSSPLTESVSPTVYFEEISGYLAELALLIKTRPRLETHPRATRRVQEIIAGIQMTIDALSGEQANRSQGGIPLLTSYGVSHLAAQQTRLNDLKALAGLEERYRIAYRLKEVRTETEMEISARPGQLFLVHVMGVAGHIVSGLYYLIKPEKGISGPVVSVLSSGGDFRVDSEGGTVLVKSWKDAQTQSRVELLDDRLAVEWDGSEEKGKLRFPQKVRYSGLRYDVYFLTAQPAGLEESGLTREEISRVLVSIVRHNSSILSIGYGDGRLEGLASYRDSIQSGELTPDNLDNVFSNAERVKDGLAISVMSPYGYGHSSGFKNLGLPILELAIRKSGDWTTSVSREDVLKILSQLSADQVNDTFYPSQEKVPLLDSIVIATDSHPIFQLSRSLENDWRLKKAIEEGLPNEENRHYVVRLRPGRTDLPGPSGRLTAIVVPLKLATMSLVATATAPLPPRHLMGVFVNGNPGQMAPDEDVVVANLERGRRETFIVDLTQTPQPSTLPPPARILVQKGARVPSVWSQLSRKELDQDPAKAQTQLVELAQAGEIVLIAPTDDETAIGWDRFLRTHRLLGIQTTNDLLKTLERLTPEELRLFLASLDPAGGLILDATLRQKATGTRELIVSA